MRKPKRLKKRYWIPLCLLGVTLSSTVTYAQFGAILDVAGGAVGTASDLGIGNADLLNNISIGIDAAQGIHSAVESGNPAGAASAAIGAVEGFLGEDAPAALSIAEDAVLGIGSAIQSGDVTDAISAGISIAGGVLGESEANALSIAEDVFNTSAIIFQQGENGDAEGVIYSAIDILERYGILVSDPETGEILAGPEGVALPTETSEEMEALVLSIEEAQYPSEVALRQRILEDRWGELPWYVTQAVLSEDGQKQLGLQDQYSASMLDLAEQGSEIAIDQIAPAEELASATDSGAIYSLLTSEAALKRASSQDVLKDTSNILALMASGQAYQSNQLKGLTTSNATVGLGVSALSASQLVTNDKLKTLQLMTATNGRQLGFAVEELKTKNRTDAAERMDLINRQAVSLNQLYIAGLRDPNRDHIPDGILASESLATPF